MYDLFDVENARTIIKENLWISVDSITKRCSRYSRKILRHCEVRKSTIIYLFTKSVQ